MSFYKLESVCSVIPYEGKHSKVRKTYKYFFNSWDSMILRFSHEMEMGATVKAKEISEAEYVRGIR